MTATQPFFQNVSKNNELAPPNVTFPQNRHNYRILPDKYEINDLLNILFDNDIPFEKSGAIVLNTKKTAIEAYNLLSSFVEADNIFFLSGWLTPKSKKRVLKELKQAEKNNELRYLVTTQVVEAGVDLDFNWVFRDFSPLDSLIQVAGRCNRHGLDNDSGIVLIAELQSKNKRGYGSYVYNRTLLDSTHQILNKMFPEGTFSEQHIPELISEYYQEIILNRKVTPSLLLSLLKKGEWENLPPLFKEEHRQVTLYVEEDEEFMPILNCLLENEWTLENRHEQKRLFNQLQQYAISVPHYILEKDCLSV